MEPAKLLGQEFHGGGRKEENLPLLLKEDKSKVALVGVDCGKPNMKLKMYSAKAAQKRFGTYVSSLLYAK